MVLSSGQKAEGLIVAFSPARLKLRLDAAKGIRTWTAAEVRTVVIGRAAYVYNSSTNTLVPASTAPAAVEATGVGPTERDALKQALLNAVGQVVGQAIDAETLIKNDCVIHERIFAFSGGFVSGYEEVSTRKEEGLVYKTILPRSSAPACKRPCATTRSPISSMARRCMPRCSPAWRPTGRPGSSSENCCGTTRRTSCRRTCWGSPSPSRKRQRKSSSVTASSLPLTRTAYQAYLDRLLPALDRMASRRGRPPSWATRRFALPQFHAAFAPPGLAGSLLCRSRPRSTASTRIRTGRSGGSRTSIRKSR